MHRSRGFGNWLKPLGLPTGTGVGYHARMDTSQNFSMTSARPFLLRALYEWIATNGCTPYLVVDATVAGTRVPSHAVKDGRITLNIADRAVQHLSMDNSAVSFQARFGGQVMPIYVPMEAVVALYAQETGAGLGLPSDEVMGLSSVLPPNEGPAPDPVPTSPAPVNPPSGDGKSKGGRGHLRIVK